MITLVVTDPFDGRGIGDRITDGDEIAAILAGEHAHQVVATGQAEFNAAPAPSKQEDATRTQED